MKEDEMAAASNPPKWKTFPVLGLDDGRVSPLPYSETEDIILPEDYRPTKYDVINGRGKKSYNHIANRRFRQLTAMNLKRYQNAKCKTDKTIVVIGIVNSIRKGSPSGGFIKKCPKTGRWISMSNEGAREKVGHCLRDMIANKREESRTTNSSKATTLAEDKIRTMALQNKKPIPPISHGFPTPPWAVQIAQTKIAIAARPAQAKGPAATAPAAAATKKSPKNSPKRKKVVVSSSNSSQAARVAHSGAPPPPPATVGVPPITSTFNNFDYSAVTKGSNQEMSLQQRRILHLLEGGFKGSVEDVIRAAQ